MSLSMPEAPKLGDWAQTGDDEYVCYTSETLFAAIEKCLDNGLGTCLVVEDQDQFVGRISLDDIGKAVLDGALLNPSLDQHVEMFAHRLANDPSSDSQVLQPVLDATGRLVGVTIDRSSQHVQVARPDMNSWRIPVGSGCLSLVVDIKQGAVCREVRAGVLRLHWRPTWHRRVQWHGGAPSRPGRLECRAG